MGRLHELLAVEKSKSAAVTKLITETFNKFGKFEYFQGHIRTLSMIEESPQNKALEAAAKEERKVPTTVHETLSYVMDFWKDSEDILFQKNVTNQGAVANILFKGDTLATDVPVDELLGLESRLETLRKLMDTMPTLSASVTWEDAYDLSGRKGYWKAIAPSVVVKTEKSSAPVILYEATKEHPAQVKEISVDKPTGTFTKLDFCGAASSSQKSEVIAIIDDLINEVKQARMRANSVEASTRKIGEDIIKLIMSPFNSQSNKQ